MRNLFLLNTRLGELRLTRTEMQVAQGLIAGMRWRQIAVRTGLTPKEVRIRAICIDRKLGRLPPTDADPTCVPIKPAPPPLAPGSAVSIAV